MLDPKRCVIFVATYATSGALASSRDALRADSDLRAYGHAIGGTAQQALRELLPQLPQPGLGTISDDYGPAAICRSMDLAAAPPPGPARLARVDYGPAMQLADEDRSDAVRRDRRLRNRLERADASVREHGTRKAMQVNLTRHALGIYYSD